MWGFGDLGDSVDGLLTCSGSGSGATTNGLVDGFAVASGRHEIINTLLGFETTSPRARFVGGVGAGLRRWVGVLVVAPSLVVGCGV